MKLENSNQLKPLDPIRIRQTHNRIVESMGLPDWVLKDPCLGCGAKLPPLSVRSIDFKLHAQVIGNIEVEILCQECSTTYKNSYQNCCHSIDDFVRILKTHSAPAECVREAMTHSQNNLMEVIYQECRDGSPVVKPNNIKFLGVQPKRNPRLI